MLSKIEGDIFRFAQDTTIGDSSGKKDPDLPGHASGAETRLSTGESAIPRISFDKFGTKEFGTDEDIGEFGHVWDTNFPPF
ncbi:MAG TPA: hypothetical protein VJL83_03780 [Patescibacteria group bacterium]|nr:hypothetical protein [Patescibacteria group bacterium]